MTNTMKKTCETCGCQVYDPFGGTLKLHDEEKCRGSQLEYKSNTPRTWEGNFKKDFFWGDLISDYASPDEIISRIKTIEDEAVRRERERLCNLFITNLDGYIESTAQKSLGEMRQEFRDLLNNN